MKHSKCYIYCSVFLLLVHSGVILPAQEQNNYKTNQNTYPLFDILRRHAAPLLLVDPESGAILDANDSAVQLYGYPYTIIKTMNISMINILRNEEIKAEMQRAQAEQRNYFNFPHRFADGSVHIMEVYSSPIKNPQGQTFLLSFVKQKELNSTANQEFARYAERLTDELGERVELYNALKIRQVIIIIVLVLCLVLFIAATVNFITYRRLAYKFAKNEQKYKNLLMSMQEGYAYHEMIFDNDGKPLDFIYIETNQAFETMTGLQYDAVIGKKISEVIPELDRLWIECYGNVVKTGKPVLFEQYEPNLNRWYRVSAFCPEPGKFATIFFDISKTKELIQKLNDAVAEKDILYHELLHRIKNTLVTIASLISLQNSSNTVPESCKPVVSHIHNQVKAYADLYALMHTSDNVQSVDGKAYFTAIIETIVQGFLETDFDLSFSCDLEPMYLDYRTASSLGLVINEVVTNIFKHAFTGKTQGKLQVRGVCNGSLYTVTVSDDGKGFPDGFSIQNSQGFGMLMMQELVKQVQGRITITRASDTGFSQDPLYPEVCISIEFPHKSA